VHERLHPIGFHCLFCAFLNVQFKRAFHPADLGRFDSAQLAADGAAPPSAATRSAMPGPD
jgi:hypothetical protein